MRLFNTLLSALFVFLSCQLTFATSYTWNGSSSSAWGTATNWTPNGVPGAGDNVTIVSAGASPVYDGVAGVTNFTISSGTLDLNGYTIDISGQGYFSGGTVSNGVVNAVGATNYFLGTIFNTKVTVVSPAPYLSGSTFNDSLIYEVTGNSSQNNGGNKFNGPVILINSGNYTPYYGHVNPDTFNYNLYVYNTGNGSVTLANSSDDHYFADTVFVNCTSGQGIFFGNPGVEYKIASGKPIVVGEDGFSAGILKLRDFVQQGTGDVDITLTGSASIWLENCEFGGDVSLTVPYIDFYYTTFNGKFDLTRSGATSNTAKGGNLYNDTVTFINTGGVFTTALNYPDTFNELVTFRNEGGTFTSGYGTADNYFNADVKVYNLSPSSAAFQFQPFGASGSTTFDGNVYVNCKSSGGVHFAPGNTPDLTMTAGHTIAVGDTGFISGTLQIRRFEQEGSFPMDLILTDAANLKVVDSDIGGHFTYEGPGFILDGATFNSDAHFTRDTTANEQLLGTNTYYGNATFINNGTGYLMFRTSDTYHGDATFIATSTGQIRPGNYSTNTFKGNIHANDPSKVTFGLDYGGSKVVLAGDGVQIISSDSAGIIAFRDLETNKSNEYSVIQRSISILDSLILTDGIIQTDTFFIEVKDNAKAVGAADTSYVEGKVKKTGNEAFTYPVGKNGHYRPIAISAPSSTSAEFVGEYFESNSDWLYDHSSKDATIDEISRNEYWGLDRTATTNTVDVTLYWDTITSCHFDSIDSLKVVSWDGSQWKDLGNGGTAGDTNSGSIITDLLSANYTAFAMATLDWFECLICNEAIELDELTGCNENEILTDTVVWYRFIPDSSYFSITLSHPLDSILYGIDSFNVYAGYCGNLELLGTTINTDSTDNRNLSLYIETDYKKKEHYLKIMGAKDSVFDLCFENLFSVRAALGGCTGLTGGTNLITNGNFESGNTGFSTAIQHTYTPPTSQLLVSHYTIVANAQNVNPNFENILGLGGSGNFMITDVNQWQPNLLLWKQTITVEKNTCYCVSGWFINVDKDIAAVNQRPNVKLSAKGVNTGNILASASTGNLLPNDPWSQHSISFNSGNNTSVDIEFISIPVGSIYFGNDVGIDGIEMFGIDNNEVEGPESTCETPQVFTFPTTGMQNYFWTVPVGAVITSGNYTNSITVDWGSAFSTGGDICVVVESAGGCITSSCLTVTGCCTEGEDAVITDGENASDISSNYPALGISSGIIDDKSFSINGTFTVDMDLTFKECDISMGRDAKIIIEPPYTLTLNYGTHIYACNDMWDGIVINGENGSGAAKLITGDLGEAVIIEDAEIAVYCAPDGELDINQTRFNKNYKGVVVDNTNGTAYDPGPIQNSIFMCQVSPTSGTGTYDLLNPPRTNDRSLVGIELMGNVAVTTLYNDFRNSETGISAHDGVAFGVGYSEFKDHGTGIGLGRINNSIIGVNEIEDCQYGIAMVQNKLATITIFHNWDITNCDFGIIGVLNNQCKINVIQNKINQTSPMEDQRIGVYFNGWIPNSHDGSAYKIHENLINDMRFGIHMTNIGYSEAIRNVIVVHDYPGIAYPSGGTNAAAGIWLAHNYLAFTRENIISSYYDAATDWDWWTIGVRSDFGSVSAVQCNEFTDISTGMQIIGVQPWTVASDNTMYGDHLNGLAITGNTMPWGSDGAPPDNRWVPVGGSGTDWSNFENHTWAYDSDMSHVNFYVRNNIPSSPSEFYPIPFLTDADQFNFEMQPTPTTVSYSPSDCEDWVVRMRTLEQIQEAVQDTANTPYKKMNLYKVYQMMSMDTLRQADTLWAYPIVLDSIYRFDSLLVAFKDSMEQTTLGQIDSVLNQIEYGLTKGDEGTNAALVSKLNGITPADTIEMYMKDMALLALNRFAVGDTSYTEGEIDDLRELAEKCPYIYGPGVYMARLMLSGIDSVPVFYMNVCESPVDTTGSPFLRSMNPSPHQIASNENEAMDFRLYPNPNDGHMYLDYDGLKGDATFEMYDMVGRKITSYTLQGESGKVSISEEQLGSGVYLYRIHNDRTTFDTGKIVIHR